MKPYPVGRQSQITADPVSNVVDCKLTDAMDGADSVGDGAQEVIKSHATGEKRSAADKRPREGADDLVPDPALMWMERTVGQQRPTRPSQGGRQIDGPVAEICLFFCRIECRPGEIFVDNILKAFDFRSRMGAPRPRIAPRCRMR